MYILETKKLFDFLNFIFWCVCVYLQQSTSDPFIKLCFEAGKWIARFDLIWDGVPQGCAWKWETSFKKVYSWFGQSYVSWWERERERIFFLNPHLWSVMSGDWCWDHAHPWLRQTGWTISTQWAHGVCKSSLYRHTQELSHAGPARVCLPQFTLPTWLTAPVLGLWLVHCCWLRPDR